MKEKEVLEKARELLALGSKWAKDCPLDPAGRRPAPSSMCLLGAIDRAALGVARGNRAQALSLRRRVASRVLGATGSTRIPPAGYLVRDELIGWNDHPRRTHAEVLDLLDRAIAA